MEFCPESTVCHPAGPLPACASCVGIAYGPCLRPGHRESWDAAVPDRAATGPDSVGTRGQQYRENKSTSTRQGGKSSVCFTLNIISIICINLERLSAKHTCRTMRGALQSNTPHGKCIGGCSHMWLGESSHPGFWGDYLLCVKSGLNPEPGV